MQDGQRLRGPPRVRAAAACHQPHRRECSYDECFDDSTCGGKVYIADPPGETTATTQANHCLAQGGRQTDSDRQRACSPPFGTCGSYFGVVAYCAIRPRTPAR